MAVKSRPSAVSRCRVMVVLLDSRSTSPDCSAVKRCCEVSGTYLTFSDSPKIAAETARQTSTSRPTHLPWLSATAKPAMPVGTPQITAPRALMPSRSLPAKAAPDASTVARPNANASAVCFILPPVFLAPSLASGGLASNRPNRLLPDRRGILQAALGPQSVRATLDLERAAHADIAIEALAVVADLLDDGVDPFLVEAERLAHAGGDAEDALDGGVVALGHLVDVGRGDTVFLGLDHGVERPAHDVGELVVAVAHHRPERLLGDDLRQDQEVVEGARRRHVGGARGGEARGVGGVDVAAAGEEGGADLVDLFDDHRLEGHLVGAEIVSEVELGRRAGGDADRGAAQLPGALHPELFRHQEALAVVVVDAD